MTALPWTLASDLPYAHYRRVSRVGEREKDERLRSPEFQLELTQAFERREGLRGKVYAPENDVSGSRAKRPILEEIVKEIEAGRCAGIIVAKLDRLSRLSPKDRVNLFDRIERAGGRVLSASEDNDMTTPEGRFVRELFLGIARMQWEQKAEGFAVARATATARGARPTPTPFGYARGPGGLLVKDPKHSKIMKKAFELAASDGIRAAYKHLIEKSDRQDYSGPKAKRVKGERRWTVATVRRALAQRTYMGDLSLGGVTYIDPKMAIVDEVTWLAAQHEPVRRMPKHDYPLSQHATCAACGGYLVGAHSGTEGRRMYRCQNSLPYAIKAGRGCAAPALTSAAALEELILQEIEREAGLDGVETTEESDETGRAALESARLERDWAIQERDEFADDTKAKRLLGKERWEASLEKRVREADAASVAYSELAKTIKTAEGRSEAPEDLRSLTPEMLAKTFRDLFAVIEVSKGRKPIATRLRLVPRDQA